MKDLFLGLYGETYLNLNGIEDLNWNGSSPNVVLESVGRARRVLGRMRRVFDRSSGLIGNLTRLMDHSSDGAKFQRFQLRSPHVPFSDRMITTTS